MYTKNNNNPLNKRVKKIFTLTGKSYFSQNEVRISSKNKKIIAKI